MACSPRTGSLHDLDAFDVRDAVQCRSGLAVVYDYNEKGNLRATLQAKIGKRTVEVVVYPYRSGLEDEWVLASAY